MALASSATALPKVDLSQAQRSYYDTLFKLADQDHDNFIGAQDADFFKKSNLNVQQLGAIWQIADVRSAGLLNRDEFIFANLLISLVQQGKQPTIDAIRSGPIPNPPWLNDIPPFKEPQQQPSLSAISPQDKKQYVDLFRNTDTDNDGFVTGQEARNLFSKSGLTMEQLGQIWTLADINKDQKLDPIEFIIAMYLITAKKRGVEIPATLPDHIIASARAPFDAAPSPNLPTPNLQGSGGPASIQKSEWTISPADRAKYDDVFRRNDTDNDGYINGEQAKALFSQSKLSFPDLSQIWRLSDVNNDHLLDRSEFAIAMFLISLRLANKPLPATLPDALILSAREDGASAGGLPNLGSSGMVDPASQPNKQKVYPNFSELFPTDAVGQGAPPPAALSVPGSLGPTTGQPGIPNTGLAFAEHRPPHQSAPGVLVQPPVGSLAQPPAPFMSTPGSYGAPNQGMPNQAGGIPAGYPNMAPGGVQIIQNPNLELQRTREQNAQHERNKAELANHIQETNVTSADVATQLVEERALAEVLAGDLRDMENQLAGLRNNSGAIKEELANLRLEVKNMKAQKENLEQLRKEKQEQIREQEDIYNMLKHELQEKTAEVEQIQREVDQSKAQLEALRNSTAEVKNYLVGAKRQISEGKLELNKTNEEIRNIKNASPPYVKRDESHLHPARSTSPANFSPIDIREARRSNSFNSLSGSGAGSQSGNTTITSIASGSSFDFSGTTDSTPFSFDNGKEDPFAYPSKQGFGYGNVTKDSFGGSPSLSNAPAPSSPSPPRAAFESAPFPPQTSQSDPFSSKSDPFSSSPFSEFQFGPSSFVGATPANSVMVPATPANSVMNDRKDPSTGSLGMNDLSKAFAKAGFGNAHDFFSTEDSFGSPSPFAAPGFGSPAIASPSTPPPSVPSHSAVEEKNDAFAPTEAFGIAAPFGDAKFAGSNDVFSAPTTDSFGSPAMESAAFPPSEAFGSSDAFGGSHDAFGGSNDAFAGHDTFGGSNEAFGHPIDAPTGEEASSGRKNSSGTASFGTSDNFGNNFDFNSKSDTFGF